MADDGNFKFDEEELVESMGKLLGMQRELAKIEVEKIRKVMKVKRKYNEFRKALYNRRNHIIQSISGFWVSAFLNHPAIADRVGEEDKKVFKYMVSLEVEDFKNEDSGYSITFNFSPNPFFEDTKLTKTYFLSDDGTTTVTSTTINWKDGKARANIDSGSAQENKGVKRRITEDSFFSWFAEEQKTLPVDVIDLMATIIREELWTDPLNYFKNEDVNGDGSDDDNDHADKEHDNKKFIGSDSNDAGNNRDDEGKVNDDNNANDSFKQGEIEEQNDDEEIEEQNEEAAADEEDGDQSPI